MKVGISLKNLTEEIEMNIRAKEIITRHKLYELVWQRPTSLIAKEFGLSDVGFAKLCKRNGIPRPRRGYWAILKAGKVLPREKLPTPEQDWEIKINRHSIGCNTESKKPYEHSVLKDNQGDELIHEESDKKIQEQSSELGVSNAAYIPQYKDEAQTRSEFFRKRWLYDRFNGRNR
jgi:hypothetical protein